MARTSSNQQGNLASSSGMNPTPRPRPHTPRYSRVQRQSIQSVASTTTLHLHWLFRSNIPRRRGSPLPNDVRKRNFFGFGEVLGVLANPSETLRSLSESKRMLEETRRERVEADERAQLRPTHTFSSLPGFFDRPAEIKAIERALEGDPSFTILFGASSVGKTAVLRQVLTRPSYHVLHFDLRIAGFADLASLYMSLSQQMEGFFMSISQDPEMPGYAAFEKDAWAFKHDRLNVERRLTNPSQSTDALVHGSSMCDIKTSDVARLMELFQSSLLSYWKFDPTSEAAKRKSSTKAESSNAESVVPKPSTAKRSWYLRMFGGSKKNRQQRYNEKSRQPNGDQQRPEEPAESGKAPSPPTKKMPVIFIDEAHKLPALIRSADAMKCLLDAMLVLTKQDRLCHVVHATSDPFYQTWLRQLNVMQHCKIITIGDYPKSDTRRFFRERILLNVPDRLRGGLDFEKIYEAFGGKLAHWQDYVTDYVNSGGKLEIKQSSHFLQAHALLNIHVIHSAQAPTNGIVPDSTGDAAQTTTNRQDGTALPPRFSTAPGIETAFRVQSSQTTHRRTVSTAFSLDGTPEAPEFQADFSALQLLRVMNRLAQPGTRSLSYFLLCREFGHRAVDAMVRGRILDLRWTEPVMREGTDGRISTRISTQVRQSVRDHLVAGSSTTAVNYPYMMGPESEEGGMEPMTDEEVLRARMLDDQGAEDEEEVVGPKILPITPIMRYAMREVVQEYYDDDQTVSEYASLSEVDEY